MTVFVQLSGFSSYSSWNEIHTFICLFFPYFLPLRTSNVQKNLRNRTVITSKIFNQTYSLVTQRVYKLCIRNIWKQAADNPALWHGSPKLTAVSTKPDQHPHCAIWNTEKQCYPVYCPNSDALDCLGNSHRHCLFPVFHALELIVSLPFFFCLAFVCIFPGIAPITPCFHCYFSSCLCVCLICVCLFSPRDSAQDLLNSVSNQCVAELLPCQETSLVVYMCFCFVL